MAEDSGRSATIVAAAIGAGGAVVAAVIAGIAGHFNSSGPPPQTIGASSAAPHVQDAQLVENCETAHGIHQRSQRDVDVSGTVITFAQCAWPPPVAADPDGYTRIVATAADGPGQDNASGANVVDRVTGPCSRFSLSYSFGSQGSDTHLSPITVSANAVVSVETPQIPFSQPLPFFPARGEADVVHNSNYTLDAANCTG